VQPKGQDEDWTDEAEEDEPIEVAEGMTEKAEEGEPEEFVGGMAEEEEQKRVVEGRADAGERIFRIIE
jgi:hypothetical protein